MYVVANYTTILASLRILLVQNNLQAYIVPAGDAHYSEFIAECHQRRAYISGFTGSAGTVIVTATNALLWTDGRYFLQAEQQLDANLWTLMKDGLPETPSQATWLKQNLPEGAKVGVDPTLYTKRQWDSMEQELNSTGKVFVPLEENLVDSVWKEDNKPDCSSDPVFNLGLEFSGKATKDKLEDVRKEMQDNSASLLAITELDEVAWLLNLRGNDIPYSAVFFAYVLVTENEFHLFINKNQLPANVSTVLKQNIPNIEIHSYENITIVLQEKVNRSSGKVWFNHNTNYALVRLVPEDRQMVQLTPIALMKATKNPTEVEGYRNALIRDSAALCEFFAWIEEEMKKGTTLTEISAAEKLHTFRRVQEHFFNDSFSTISAAGENGAVIHYMPTPETDREIKTTDMYLLDSGGLYKDGTTDITRTTHFGNPTQHQKDCYTRVLKGQIALTTAVFPSRMAGSRLDSFARQFLWEVGLDYMHGTGHGVGSFLNVHEGPFSIGSGYNSLDPGLRPNFFTSNEPGYYEDNEFGIRLENIILVKNVSLDHNFQNRGFIGFEDVTFVPYEHKLIDFSLLTEAELDYLNKYQESIRNNVGEYIRQHDMSDEAYNWMQKATVPVDKNGPISDGNSADGIRLQIFLLVLPVFSVINKLVIYL